MLFLRSLAFYACMLITTPLVMLLLLICYPLPYPMRFRAGRNWADVTLWTLRKFCRLDWEFQDLENLPTGPAIVMCKHQSAWETMALQQVVPPHVWILKRELLWIPIFGWGLALLDPVGIDRSAGLRAMRAVIREGSKRLEKGTWLVVYPEGTRTAPGEKRSYQPGGGLLAEKTGYPVVPVAHNAGLFWPRASFIKRPGHIKCVIGPVIETEGRRAPEIMRDIEAWIETTSEELLSAGDGCTRASAKTTELPETVER
ncbi:MAG: lysophospholipid acyltransferase family protein [Woeseiaceae bacterium]